MLPEQRNGGECAIQTSVPPLAISMLTGAGWLRWYSMRSNAPGKKGLVDFAKGRPWVVDPIPPILFLMSVGLEELFGLLLPIFGCGSR